MWATARHGDGQIQLVMSGTPEEFAAGHLIQVPGEQIGLEDMRVTVFVAADDAAAQRVVEMAADDPELVREFRDDQPHLGDGLEEPPGGC